MTRPFFQLVSDLEEAIARPLPASTAHILMAPQPRREWPGGLNPARIRNAAALLLVMPIADRAHIVLTVRADTLGRHSGQVSLPGGVVEAGESFEHAALREANEEIAVAGEAVRVIGRLTPIEIPVSGFRLHPVVGVANARLPLMPADGEVARILEVPIDDLMQPACLVTIERERDGRVVEAPTFCVGGEQIWGATAMVLAEFLTLLGWRTGT